MSDLQKIAIATFVSFMLVYGVSVVKHEVTKTAAIVEVIKEKDKVTETAAVVEVIKEKPMFFKMDMSSIISAVTGEKQTEPFYFVCEIDSEKFINERIIDCIPEEDGS